MKVGDSVQFGEITNVLELPTKTVYEVDSGKRKCWYNIEAIADKMEEAMLGRKDLVKCVLCGELCDSDSLVNGECQECIDADNETDWSDG